MKKEYISPSMVYVQIECESVIADSIGIDKESPGGTELLSNERRGSWGNVWGK